MSKKILQIDPQKCIGCNTCPLIAPDYFELDTNSYIAKVKKQPDNFDDPLIAQAIASCPVGAISIVETSE